VKQSNNDHVCGNIQEARRNMETIMMIQMPPSGLTDRTERPTSTLLAILDAVINSMRHMKYARQNQKSKVHHRRHG
jgi:hypothetical protein